MPRSQPPSFSLGQTQGMNSQMQTFVRHFLELIKKGDIDQVLQERNRNNIDMASLVDE